MRYDVDAKKLTLLGGSPGLVVMGRDSRSEGREFESQHHIFVVKIVMIFD